MVCNSLFTKYAKNVLTNINTELMKYNEFNFLKLNIP